MFYDFLLWLIAYCTFDFLHLLFSIVYLMHVLIADLMFSFLFSWRPSERKNRVPKKVTHCARLTGGGGFKSYLGSAETTNHF